MRIRLGKKTEMILLCLAGGVYITAQLLDMILMGGRSGSYKRAYRRLYGGLSLPEKTDVAFANKQQFYNLLTKLKKQGLVERKISEGGIMWKITSAGLRKLKLFKDNRKEYDVVPDNKLKIVAYDIPERKKRERAWIREILRLLRFQMLQKSLWIGKSKIPENFLQDLDRKGITDHVHVFEISKSGTLKEAL